MGFVEFPQGQNTGMELIQTIAASAATGVSFTNISPAYKSLRIEWVNVFQSDTTNFFFVRLNNSSASNYIYTGVYLNAGSLTAHNAAAETGFGAAGNGVAPIARTGTSSSFTDNSTGFFEIRQASTNGFKGVSWGAFNRTPPTSVYTGPIFMNGQFNGSAPVTQVDFVRNSSQTITGTFFLYGIN